MPYFVRPRFHICEYCYNRCGNCHWFGEDEDHRADQWAILVVAARHLARHQTCLASMVALHRSILLRCELRF